MSMVTFDKQKQKRKQNHYSVIIASLMRTISLRLFIIIRITEFSSDLKKKRTNCFPD